MDVLYDFGIDVWDTIKSYLTWETIMPLLLGGVFISVLWEWMESNGGNDEGKS